MMKLFKRTEAQARSVTAGEVMTYEEREALRRAIASYEDYLDRLREDLDHSPPSPFAMYEEDGYANEVRMLTLLRNMVEGRP